MKEQHLLVDYENVQPTIEDLLKLAPKLTDVWLFHGPNQIKRAEQLKAAHERVVLVPHSGKGKNALDFHLSFYLGYVAAKHPAASLMVVANDKGYDSMIEHAKLLGFTASRSGFKAKKAPAAKEAVAPAKKVAAGKTTKPAAKKAAAPVATPPAPAKKQAASPAKKVKTAPAPQKKAPKAAQTVHPPAVKKAAVKSVTAPAKKAPAKKVTAKKAVTKAASTQQAPAAKAVASPPDKVLARAKASLAKMGKNRPTKLASLLRHLKSIVGQGASEADADALSRRLEAANVIQVVGDLVLYP